MLAGAASIHNLTKLNFMIEIKIINFNLNSIKSNMIYLSYTIEWN